MAPEVMLSGLGMEGKEGEQKGYNQAADIWSLGITAIELATGEAPYQQLEHLDAMVKILDEKPPTLEQAAASAGENAPAMPKRAKKMSDFVKQCMHKTAHERYSAAQLLEHEFLKKYAKDGKYLVEKVYRYLPENYLEELHRGKDKAPQSGPSSHGSLRKSGRFTVSGGWDFKEGAPGQTAEFAKPSSLARSEAPPLPEEGSAAAVLILGSTVRQGGRSASLTAPNGKAQGHFKLFNPTTLN